MSLFSKTTQTKKNHHSLFIEDRAIKNKIETRKMQEKNGHKFLQLMFHLCLLVQGIQLQRQKK